MSYKCLIKFRKRILKIFKSLKIVKNINEENLICNFLKTFNKKILRIEIFLNTLLKLCLVIRKH